MARKVWLFTDFFDKGVVKMNTRRDAVRIGQDGKVWYSSNDRYDHINYSAEVGKVTVLSKEGLIEW